MNMNLTSILLVCMYVFAQFTTDYWFEFMSLLQGRIPVRINLFLLVNPPAWFGSVWKIMKPMLSPEFQERVHMIPESHLPAYLAHGYCKYLPDEMETGQVSTAALVHDYVTYRKYVEFLQGVYDPSKPSKQRSNSMRDSKSSPLSAAFDKPMSMRSLMSTKGCRPTQKFVD
jgi:CRAL/TRIO domain